MPYASSYSRVSGAQHLGKPIYTSSEGWKIISTGESWHAPYIGEHSEQTLVDVLGFTKQEAQQLMHDQVVPTPSGPRAIQTSRDARNQYAAKMKSRREKYKQKSRL